ncbi:hypothetical protein PHET_06426 [Paragonimus heterotremus]|uniref:STAS domain-containing protein n=1 Tax=Paragonimus heterotremus TaxID=100268 RepID=A0A8J4T913_9TREM|nr:hypothetical protein PHET_06426 [Paragonimus heterotremus]
MSAIGLANICGGFFRCHAASAALARTSVAASAGMQSQVASLISCGVLALVLTLIGPTLQTVPMCVLSSLIAVSLTGILNQIMDLRKLYHTSVIDMLIWLVTFTATVCIDVPFGLIVGLGFSLLTVLYRTQMCNCYELGQIQETDLYVARKWYTEAKSVSGVQMLRYGGPVYYASAEHFTDWIIQQTGVDPNKAHKLAIRLDQGEESRKPNSPSCSSLLTRCVKARTSKESTLNHVQTEQESRVLKKTSASNQLRYLILDASSWTFVDFVGSKAICGLVGGYKHIGIEVLLASCQPPIFDMLVKNGFAHSELQDRCFLTMHDAVLYCKQNLSTEKGVTTGEFVLENVCRV